MSSAPDSQFGKYELLDRIAAGGMAEIFRARYSPAQGVTKQVVIKKILPHYAANRAFIQMFTNEARIAMGLSHGNIAQVFDFGDIDGDYFLAMELVDGQPLSKVLRRARALGISAIPPEFAAAIIAETLKGLHYAHERLDDQGRPLKIVHRDISPQNVLLSYEGQVKLVDFGIARARNAGPEDTASAAVKGKYAYFAPEQARGKELDSRTDVFACGTVLYELLTGQLPFPGRMMDAISRIVRGQFQRPRELNPEVPEELERICLKAMALEMDDRYQTAQAFQQDLSRYLAEAWQGSSSSRLAMFLCLLFEEDLAHAGRPVQLPPDFMQEAQRWKRAAPVAEEPGRESEPAPAQALAVTHDETPAARRSTPKEARRRRRRASPFPWARALGLFAASMTVGITLVLLAQRYTRATLELSSSPPGATVRVEGTPASTSTPALVGELEGGRTYHVEVTLDGYLPWVNDVPLKRGQHLVVNARLAPSPPPEPVPLPTTDPTPPKKALPPVPDEVRWPAAEFLVDVARHRVELPNVGALSVVLEPSSTYKVWLAKGPMLGWGYLVVNGAGALPGPFTEAPLRIKSATGLYVFHFGEEEGKPRQLFVQSQSQKHPTPLRPAGTLKVPDAARVHLSGLSPDTVYELTVLPAEPAPKVDARPLAAVVVLSPKDGLIVQPLGTALRVSEVSELWLTTLGDGKEVGEGRLQAHLRALPQPKKKKGKHH